MSYLGSLVFYYVWLLSFIEGLFLDQLMTDCHGLPFTCTAQQQRAGSLNGMSQSQYRNDATNTMASTLFRQHTSTSNDGGLNPADMSSVVKQNSNFFNGEGVVADTNSGLGNNDMNEDSTVNNFKGGGNGENLMNINDRQNMVNSRTHSEHSGFDPFGQQGNTGKTGQGLSINEKTNPFQTNDLSNSFPGNKMLNSNSFPGGGMSGSGMSGSIGFPGSSISIGGGNSMGPNLFSVNSMQNSGMSQSSVTGSQSKDQGDLKTALVQLVGNVCGIDWINCPKTCFSVNKLTGCPTCSCKRTKQQSNTIQEANQNQFERSQCPPFPRNCPKSCVQFDDNGCTICSCDATPCPPFPDDCPRGFSKINENGCPVCTLNDAISAEPMEAIPRNGKKSSNQGNNGGGRSWYDKMWRA